MFDDRDHSKSGAPPALSRLIPWAVLLVILVALVRSRRRGTDALVRAIDVASTIPLVSIWNPLP
jgi:MYXO-CTERM domain-containing protein